MNDVTFISKTSITPDEKKDLLSESGIKEITSPDLIIDTSREPVKVSANFFDPETGESEVNTIWAEKADYLDEDNIGIGLENKPAWVYDKFGNKDTEERTFVLNLKQAQHHELGGVRLPNDNSLYLDNNQQIRIDYGVIRSKGEFIATEEKPGLVRPGSGVIYDKNTGIINVEPYILPTATNVTKGGVVVDNEWNVRMGGESTDRLRVFSEILRRSDLVDLSDDEKQAAGEKLDNLDFILETLINGINANNTLIGALKDRIKTYIDESSVEHGSIITGEGTFNGSYYGGRGGAKVVFDKPLADNYYHVVICQSSSTLGDVGEVSVIQKLTTGFTVSNTGNNDFDTFIYIVVPGDVTYSHTVVKPEEVLDENGLPLPRVVKQMPIKRGTGKFRGTTGTTITINGNVNIFDGSSIIASPAQPSGNGNGSSGFTTRTNYAVFITPTSLISPSSLTEQAVGGKIGEYWVEQKTEQSFVVKCTGSAPNICFDWIAIPIGVDGADMEANSQLNYDPAVFPFRVGTVTTTNSIAEVNFTNNVFSNKRYGVILQLSSSTADPSDPSDIGGHLGEYCVSETSKQRNSFEIKHSGKCDTFSIDWITIDKRISYIKD